MWLRVWVTEREYRHRDRQRKRKMLVKVFQPYREKNHEECGKLKVAQGDWNMEWEVEVTQANVNSLGRAF